MDSGTLSQTAVLTTARVSLFYFCRKYLLRSLYYDLRRLALPSALSSFPIGTQDYELDVLPAPVTSSEAESFIHETPRLRDGIDGTFHTISSSTAFALCFSESCTLFLLVMLQALGIFNPRSRSFNWTISLTLLVSLILIFIPFLQCLFLTSRSSLNSQRTFLTRLIITSVPFSIYLFIVSRIPLPSNFSETGLVSSAISRLTVLGTLILGLLSGYGAISTVWSFFPFGKRPRRKDISERDIIAAEQALYRVRNDLIERQRTIEARESARNKAKEKRTWMSSVGLGGDSELGSIRHEIKGLTALETQMSQSLEALKARKTSIDFDETLSGTAWRWFGRIFAVYCIARIGSSIVDFLFPSSSSSASSSGDIIPHLIALLISRAPSHDRTLPATEEDITNLSRQISLALVGAIILSSIRRVLSGVGRLLRVTSQSLGASLMLLLLAQLMGVYLLSTLVQLRTSFPPSPLVETGNATNLFSSLPQYQVFGSFFDGSFLFAAFGSLLVRWLSEKMWGSEWPEDG